MTGIDMVDSDGTNDLQLPPILPHKLTSGATANDSKSDDDPGERSDSDQSKGVWIPLPSPPKVDTRRVWHYCSPAGAIGIVESNTLWATSLASLNDDSEFDHGLSKLRSAADEVLCSRFVHPLQKGYIESVVQQVTNDVDRSTLFAFCASEDPDSLSQWRGYADGPGYALGLGIDHNFLSVVDESRAPTNLPGSGPWPQWGRVVYDAEEQRQLLLRGLTYCAITTPTPDGTLTEVQKAHSFASAVGVMTGLLAFCKHPAFSDEREVRVVTLAPESSIKFRGSRFGITPYVRLAYSASLGASVAACWTIPKPSILPIEAVTVGPSANGAAAMKGAAVMFKKYLGRTVGIEQSYAPFR